MKLKWQISIIAFLSLSFPWVVWQSFKALNHTFQSNMLAAVDKQAQITLSSLQQFYNSHSEDLTGFVVSELPDDSAIDGNITDWEMIPWYHINHRMRFKLGQSKPNQANNKTHLLVEVLDNSPFTHLTLPADRLILAVGSNRGIQKITLSRQAEGLVYDSLLPPDFTAFWHEMSTGYQVEISFDTNNSNRLGMAAVNHATAESSVTFGHIENDQIQLTKVFSPNNDWLNFLQQITPEDGQIVLSDHQDRLLYSTNKISHKQQASDWLTEIIYELAFDQDQTDGSNFFGQRVSKNFAAGKVALTISHTEAQLALIQTSIRAVFWIFFIALLLLLAYFFFALFLAWRINRLNKKLHHVLDDHGQLHLSLPSAKAKDEIGDLSRGMSSLLRQINDYTEYLKQLGSRLSHEMKTPISIVHTSLENLHMEQPNNEFVGRALTANNRLKFILNQLSALSQLKQSIADSEKEHFELNTFLLELCQGYQLNSQQIIFTPSKESVFVNQSQDLLAQMVDKLIQNALDFIGPDDTITIALTTTDKKQNYQLTVTNTGSQIDAEKIPQLFDSLTSFRTKKSDEPHLGLGLYIVKLICDYHQAQIKALNLTDPDAVQFIVTGKMRTIET